MLEKVLGFVAGISMSKIPTLYGPEYLGSFPYRGILSRRLPGGRALGLWVFGASPLLLRSAPFGWPRTASGNTDERGIFDDDEEASHQTWQEECW